MNISGDFNCNLTGDHLNKRERQTGSEVNKFKRDLEILGFTILNGNTKGDQPAGITFFVEINNPP